MKLATFQLDVTPPVGAQMSYQVNEEIGDPIYISGVILDDGHKRGVIVSCDYIYIWGRTWLEWRRAIADAAEAAEENVFLHSVHQHDSMRISPDWNEFTRKEGKVCVDEGYCASTLANLQKTIREAVGGKWRAVTGLLTAEKRLSKLASNRRLLDKDGKCYGMRFSMCTNPDFRAHPSGNYDPLLRTVAFAGEKDEIIAALHFYASHPMAGYLRSKVSRDAPGIALDYAAQQWGQDTFQIYLTGCAGNVTFGKYFSGDKEESRARLGKKLGEGILSNLRHLEKRPMGSLVFDKVEFQFPFALEIQESDNDFRRVVKTIVSREKEIWERCNVYRLSLADDVHLLSFPSEICVEYQLYAQSLLADHFVACAAYGNAVYHYVPTAVMYEEGGYEPSASFCTPEIDVRLKAAIAKLLEGLEKE